MADYQSIFAGKAAPKSAAPPSGGGYRSIFAAPKTVDIAGGALLSAQIANRVAQPAPAPLSHPSLLSRVGGIGKAVGRDISAPFVSVGQKAVQQGKYLFGTPTATERQRSDLLDNQSKAVASKPPLDIQKAFNKVGPAAAVEAQKMLAEGVGETDVRRFLDYQAKVKSTNDKKTLGTALSIASYAIGGGKAAEGVAGATEGALLPRLTKGVLEGGVSGAVGNAGSTLSQAPDSSFKTILKSAGQGAAFGGALGGVSTALGAALKKVRTGGATESSLVKDLAPKISTNPALAADIKRASKLTPDAYRKEFSTPNAPLTVETARLEQASLKRAMAAEVDKTPVAELNQAVSKAPLSEGEAAKQFENIKVEPKKTVLGSIKNAFNPVSEYGAKGKQALSEFQSKLGELSNDLSPVTKDSAKRQAVFDKMTPQEHLRFIYNEQHGLPQPTKELQDLSDTYKKFNKQGAEIAKTLSPNFHEVENYFTQSGIVSKKDATSLAEKWTADKSNLPGSLKSRKFPTVDEAIKFANDNGINVKETNPEKLFMNNHRAVLTSARLREFGNEQVAKGTDPQIAQKIIDRYSERGISSSPGFKRYRQTAGTFNSVQLAGGYHFGKTAFEKVNNDLSTVVNDFASGHGITAGKDLIKTAGENIAGFGYRKGSNLAKDVANGVDNRYTEAVKLANFRTSTDTRYAVNGIRKSIDQMASGSAKEFGKGLALSPLRLINTSTKPLMNKWVPAIKNAAFMNQVDAVYARLGEGATLAEKARAFQEAGNTVDGIMGQMNQDNLFWSKTGKDALSVAMRSPGYNIGTVQQVGGGVKDLLSPSTYKALAQGKGLSTRAAYTVAMTANTALLGAITTYLFTGHGPKSTKDYFYPPTGKTNAAGDPERVSLPSYAKDIFAFTHNPTQTVGNKLSPLLSVGNQIRTNKDYYGNNVRNPQDSTGTQLKQTGTFLKNSLLPFSVTNANKRVGGGNAAKAESFFGMGLAPGYITKSPFEQKVQSALNVALGSKPLTPEEQQLINSKSEAKKAFQTGDTSKIDGLVNSGQITQKQGDNLKSAAQQTSLANSFQYLLKVDRPAAAKLISGASPTDIKKLGDTSQLIYQLQKSTLDFNSKQSTRDASNKLLQALNKHK